MNTRDEMTTKVTCPKCGVECQLNESSICPSCGNYWLEFHHRGAAAATVALRPTYRVNQKVKISGPPSTKAGASIMSAFNTLIQDTTDEVDDYVKRKKRKDPGIPTKEPKEFRL